MLSGISIMIYMRIDQIMIKTMLGERELGIYAAVLPISTVWQVIPVTLAASLAPFVARKKAESETAYWQALATIFRWFSLLGWLVCIPTALLSNLMINVFFGSSYESGGTVVAIYVFTNLFINVGVAQSLWLLNERRSLVGLYKTLIGAGICILGNLALIPTLGIVGAAIVAVLSQLGSSVLSNFFFSKQLFFLQIKSLFAPNERF
jgi:O-antigen/teichoic acid export membrane protein